ncbi:MAG TPA: hypothetical protein VGN01_02740, partial [Acidobacteriaceae bacterium]
STSTWNHTNVYAGGKLIGTYDGNVGSPALHFHFDDPLGTRRAQASSSGVLEAVQESSAADRPPKRRFHASRPNCVKGVRSGKYLFFAANSHRTTNFRDTQTLKIIGRITLWKGL